jgi:hypothetical protein
MIRYLIIPLLLGCGILFAKDSITNTGPILDTKTDFQDIWGEETNGLQPYVSPSISRDDWTVEVGFLAQADFSGHTWLKITNHISSKLELWQTNGVKVISKNPDVLTAFHLQKQTPASEILNFHPRQGRVYQWWLVGRPVDVGTRYGAADFSLQSAFDVSFTNDYVLQITPLLYKVDTNEVNATLVEFPPIKIKLMADGHVQKLE